MDDSVPNPTEVEMRDLKRDAAANVTDARKALEGDKNALVEWRKTRVPPSAS